MSQEETDEMVARRTVHQEVNLNDLNNRTDAVEADVAAIDTRVDDVETALAPKVYRVLLSQSGTDPIVAVALENTLGSIVWTRGGAGGFTGTLNGAFPANKTFFQTNGVDLGSQVGDEFFLFAEWATADVINLFLADINGDALDGLGRGYLSIIVYP
jgi:hypothetical protein